MDNASKALIMAGAVLIAVALVGLGVYLYRSATSSIESGANTIDEASVQMNNQIVKKYGANKKVISKANAHLLCEDVIRANNAGKLAASICLGDTEKISASKAMKEALALVPTTFKDASYTLEYETDTNGSINKVKLTAVSSS